jgi:broad specificity phosphatase PhoE
MLFVRHGETEANKQRLALGRADPPLTENGAAQAQALAGRLGP